LYHKGVIICLCSKNNEADVWEVFRNHPDMVVKEKHIAAYQINWDDKATNLKRIAADLNRVWTAWF
jgi:predicted enzyme involved in methoxymalonyl-ACP biosynthesis